MPLRAPGLRHDALIAIGLAAALGSAWAARDWTGLVQLRLPDTDDVMRLQQVRDWLAGQRWSDLAQHRLADGVAMHWTRLADLAPAALISGLSPLIGRHAAEVAAVGLLPPVLFALALLLIARIARALGADAGSAAVVAAIAYPATTLFAPGRIDHHGLQMDLLLGGALACIGPASWRRGAAAGLCAAASLVVGLETAPLFAALALWVVACWVRDSDARPIAGMSGGALVGLLAGRLAFAPDAFASAACDGFTQAAWRAAAVLSLAGLALAMNGRLAATRCGRSALALAIGACAAAAAVALAPECLHPYGRLDPLLARVWLARVGEAQPLLAAPAPVAIGYAGVMLTGFAATAWQAWRTRSRGWWLLLVLLLAALATTCTQLRGAYAGALLAAPGLAAAIAAARTRGVLPLAGAWAASAGMVYPVAAGALTPAASGAPATSDGDCTSPALLAVLARLPSGTVAAPIDAGPAILAATPYHVLAAPYHRNNAGNRAAFLIETTAPARAAAIARAARIDYLVACSARRHPLPGWRTLARLSDGTRVDAPLWPAGSAP